MSAAKAWTFHTIAPTDGAAGVPDSAQGKWKRGLCDCFRSIGMCCCVCWCQPCTIGQVSSISRGGAAWVCLLVTFGILAFNAGAQFFQIWYQNDLQNFVVNGVTSPPGLETLLSTATLLGLAASLCACGAVWNARAAYRRRDKIPGECGVFSDCLSAWCCAPCSVCQMFSQDSITFAASYGTPYKLFWNPYGSGVGKAEEAVATAV